MKNRLSLLRTLTAILLVGYFLRVTQLGALGIWGDEAFSIAVGQMALPKIIEGGRDTLPPLFHIIFHFWLQAVGISEFSARYLALIEGMLLMSATYVVSRRLLNPAAAVVAASLISLSPFAIYYSQEARMYSQQAALFIAISVYGFLRLHEKVARMEPHGFRQLATELATYFISTLAAMYSHYYVFFIIAAQNIYAFWLWRKRPRWLAGWIGAQFLLAILYLPWVFAQVGYLSGKANQRWDAWGLSGLRDVWVNTLTGFSVGATAPKGIGFLAPVVLILVCIGLVIVLRKTRLFPSPWRRFAAMYLLLPLFMAWAMGPIMPFFYPRFLLPILPAFIVLLAAGIAGLWQFRRALAPGALALVIAIQLPAMVNLNRSPQSDKSNYREIMAYISQNVRPDDGLLLLNPEQDALYAYYGDKSLRAYWFPPTDSWDSVKNQRRMARIESSYQRLWLVLFGNARDWDPGNNLQNWLNQHAFRAYHADYVDGALELYIVGAVQPDTALDAVFGGTIRVAGFGVSSATIAPGDTIQLALSLTTRVRPDKDYTLFAHVVDAQQQIVGQFDGQPGAGTHPTSKWQPGETSIERLAILIKPGTPPGDYWLQIGWYDLATLNRLLASDSSGKSLGDHVILIPITVR